MQEKHHPKSLLWEKGPFPLVKPKSQSPYFSKDAASREQVMPCRGKDGGAGGPGVPGREGGTKDGKEQTHKRGPLGKTGTQNWEDYQWKNTLWR